MHFIKYMHVAPSPTRDMRNLRRVWYGIWSHHFMANRWGNNGNSESLFSQAPKSLKMVTVAMKLKDACSLEEKL